MLEISLRNALHGQLTELAAREDWWNAKLLLPWDITQNLIHSDTKDEIQKAILSATRKLRNRIAHHEPVFDRNLATDHQIICNLVGYIEPEAKIWVMNNSRIVEILALKEQRLNGQIRSSF